MVASSIGFVLTVRWGNDVPALPMTAWQLLGGSIVLVPVALIFEGAPPALTLTSAMGFAYVTLIATAVAYIAWFTGLRRLQPATVGIVGLLNPVTGVVLGVAIAGEAFGLLQGAGLALVLVGVALGALAPKKSAVRSRLGAVSGSAPGSGSGSASGACTVPGKLSEKRRPATVSTRAVPTAP